MAIQLVGVDPLPWLFSSSSARCARPSRIDEERAELHANAAVEEELERRKRSAPARGGPVCAHAYLGDLHQCISQISQNPLGNYENPWFLIDFR